MEEKKKTSKSLLIGLSIFTFITMLFIFLPEAKVGNKEDTIQPVKIQKKDDLIFGKYTKSQCFNDKEGCFFDHSLQITMSGIAKDGKYSLLSNKSIRLCELDIRNSYKDTSGLVLIFKGFESKGDKFLVKIMPKNWGVEKDIVTCLMQYTENFTSVEVLKN